MAQYAVKYITRPTLFSLPYLSICVLVITPDSCPEILSSPFAPLLVLFAKTYLKIKIKARENTELK